MSCAWVCERHDHCRKAQRNRPLRPSDRRLVALRQVRGARSGSGGSLGTLPQRRPYPGLPAWGFSDEVGGARRFAAQLAASDPACRRRPRLCRELWGHVRRFPVRAIRGRNCCTQRTDTSTPLESHARSGQLPSLHTVGRASRRARTGYYVNQTHQLVLPTFGLVIAPVPIIRQRHGERVYVKSPPMVSGN